MNVCVVAPHPDDETLGAGGTLLRLKEEGHRIYWLNMTSMKAELGYTSEQISEKEKQVDMVCKAYQFDDRMDMNLTPTKLEMYDSGEIISKIGNYFGAIKPELLILPNPQDVHTDHKKVFEWCYACTKRFRHSYIKKVVSMEILSESDFAYAGSGFEPNMFVDISDYLEKKLEIMKIYSREIGEHPFPRSLRRIEALATFRGGC